MVFNIPSFLQQLAKCIIAVCFTNILLPVQYKQGASRLIAYMIFGVFPLPFGAHYVIISMNISDFLSGIFFCRQFTPVKHKTDNLVILLYLIS